MAKKPRTESDIRIEKDRILSEALQLIEESDFNSLTMRKLASRLGITATTIYNYFSSKDEIYLIVLTTGFEKLYERIDECHKMDADCHTRVKAMFKAYIRFGIEESSYYNIMFTYNVPKYNEYLDRKERNEALEERRVAMKVLNLINSLVQEIIESNPKLEAEKANLYTMQLWCTLHGYVSLYNSHVIQTVEDQMDTLMENIINHLLGILFS